VEKAIALKTFMNNAFPDFCVRVVEDNDCLFAPGNRDFWNDVIRG
jgi:hypothetical protein